MAIATALAKAPSAPLYSCVLRGRGHAILRKNTLLWQCLLAVPHALLCYSVEWESERECVLRGERVGFEIRLESCAVNEREVPVGRRGEGRGRYGGRQRLLGLAWPWLCGRDYGCVVATL